MFVGPIGEGLRRLMPGYANDLRTDLRQSVSPSEGAELCRPKKRNLPLFPNIEVSEQKRLNEARERAIPWKKWGPYLSERQWGTVREDYSESRNRHCSQTQA